MNSKLASKKVNRIIGERGLHTTPLTKASVMEWYDLTKLIIVRDIMNHKDFIKGKEMILKDNMSAIKDKVMELYERYSIYRYFGDLEYKEQKNILLTMALVEDYIEKEPEWFNRKVITLYPKELTMAMVVARFERQIDFEMMKSTVILAFNKDKSVCLGEAFYTFLVMNFMMNDPEAVINMALGSSEASQLRKIFHYDERTLLEKNTELITQEMVDKAQDVYSRITSGKKWRFKEKKTIYSLVDEIVAYMDEKEYERLVEDDLIDFVEVYRLTYNVNSICYYEWVSLVSIFDLKDVNRPNKIGVIGLLSRLASMVKNREKINTGRTLLEKELIQMVEEQKELVNRQQSKQNSKANKKAINSVIAKETQELQLALEQALAELKRTQADLKEAKTTQAIVKNNLRIAEKEKRELLQTLNTLTEAQQGEVVSAVEFKAVDIEPEVDYDSVKLPQNIVFVAGHPNLRNNVKIRFGWEVVDIDKINEVSKFSGADLILYNSYSNNHAIFNKLSQEDFSKIVYTHGGTNLDIIENLAKRGWYERNNNQQITKM